MKLQQQGIVVPNPYSANPGKTFIKYKDKNQTELNKVKSKNYFTKALLELGDQGFNKEEVSSCANIL